MHPDDDSQTTLSKWPFILGDILLVATGLAIANLGGWQLTDWQVGACVAAVALGAALFVLPYIVEYRVRVREEREDRAADLRILEKHLLAAEQAIDASDTRIRALESAAAQADDPNAALAEAMDQKFAQLEAARAAQMEAIETLRKDLKELAAKEPAPVKVEPKASDSEQKAPKPEQPEPSIPVPEKKAAPIDRPQREARERHGPEESRLLKRAISENGDKSSTAVSRIISPKLKEVEPAAEAPKESERPEVEPEKEAPANKPEAIKDEVPKEEPEAVPEPVVATPEEPKRAPEPAEDHSAPAGSEMLFDADKITSPMTRTKARKNDAVLTASVFIGIGNKPYLRGSGAGLNWEKGQLMEFQEIGKWRWVAPSDLDAPVELQIYRNDEDPDQSGKYTITAGQKLEVSPVF